MLKIILCVSLVAIGSGITWYQYAMSRPLYQSNKKERKILSSDTKEAMEDAKKLVDALMKVGWDTTKIPFDMKVLPGQEMAEDKNYHSRRGVDGALINVSPWCFVPVDDPVIPDVAMYTDLYVKKNVVIYKNEKGSSTPEGFFIVAFRDGTVSEIPILEVRMVHIPGSMKDKSYVFPGTKMYNSTLPRAFETKK